jgi:hypothetical protein
MTAISKPNFLVVGAQRCGTTWLHENLRTHPDVFLPATKELNFFSDIKSSWSKGFDWYFNQFSGAEKYKAIGEITPEYFVDPYAAERIEAALGNIKIICILRAPVERAYSSYKKGLRELNWNCSFEDFMENDIDFSVKRGLYAPQLERYLSIFGKENVLVLSYDQIDREPHEFLRSVYRFIGVDETYQSPLLENSFNVGSSGGLLIRVVVKTRNIIYRLPGGRALIKAVQRTKLGNYLMKVFLKSQSGDSGDSFESAFKERFEDDIAVLDARYGIKFVKRWAK